MNVGTIAKNLKAGGASFNKSINIVGNSSISQEPSIPAAKTGVLTVRTDNDTGSLTMDPGHGITTGAKIDIYWTGGSRRGVTVGTVATNVVPIDLGLGDNLPAAATPITAMVQLVKKLRFDGDDLVALIASCSVPATVVLSGDDDVEDFAIVLPISGEQQYEWTNQDNSTNPVATDTITKARMTHGSTSAQVVKIGAALL